MKFSVLMSIYHREQPEFLRQCLQSLCAQTLAADEVVLVYDGPLTPQLEAVADSFQAALPLKIVRLAENVGLGRALNEGLAHCSHDWVFRMDGDDICLPERFAFQAAYLQTHPDTDIVGTQIAEFDADPAAPHAARRVPCDNDTIRRFARRRNPFNHMTVAYRKRAVLAAGGYHHHLYMEDYNLWLRMLAAGARAANLPETLVLARTGAAMLRRRRGRAYAASEWRLYRLKRSLRIQRPLPALYCFAARALPRLLPPAVLARLYSLTRRP